MTPSREQPTQDEFFHQVVRLYDLTDDVVNAIGMSSSVERAHWLELVRPLIETSNHSVDTLCEIVTSVERHGAAVDDQKKAAMVEAFNRVFQSIEAFKGNA